MILGHDIKTHRSTKRAFRTDRNAPHTHHTLRRLDAGPPFDVLGDIDIEWTLTHAGAAASASVPVPFDPEDREQVGELQRHGHRAEVFAECPIVFQ